MDSSSAEIEQKYRCQYGAAYCKPSLASTVLKILHEWQSWLSTAGKLNLLSMKWRLGRILAVGHACMKRKETMWSP